MDAGNAVGYLEQELCLPYRVRGHAADVKIVGAVPFTLWTIDVVTGETFVAVTASVVQVAEADAVTSVKND